jgi:hypothetical protein
MESAAQRQLLLSDQSIRLKNALQQGLQVHQLLALINKYGRKPIPPNIPAALERWKQNELEAVLEQLVLLRVRSAAILDQVMASRAKTLIITRLNETTAVVKPTQPPSSKKPCWRWVFWQMHASKYNEISYRIFSSTSFLKKDISWQD